ncbi:DnaJ family domain-containing protein [Rubinisphaera margarita]|uniref:DnaJ family domain-containing protein n=1 Tax=Rubinisphaera margarita TaxID=2909586 RepID=UPI001EE97478|nr:DUF1992 domain-containing protein [Rubinisphaera margarita]MCG6158374.1 DUF1992 domain-containing protein [Rubinisphaera margarita]
MQEKKTPHESYEAFADRLIREAEARGEFANLPGLGKPIPGLNKSRDENWWIRDKLRRENFNLLPERLQVKLEIEKLMESLDSFSSEAQLRTRIRQLNEKVRAAHFSAADGPTTLLTEVDEENVVAQWRAGIVT